MSEAERVSKIRAAAIEALARLGLCMGKESVQRVMCELREIVRLCDDVR